MDQTVAIAISIIQVLLVPLIIFLMQRGMGKKLDSFDSKRDRAREEQKRHREEEEEWRDHMTSGMRAILRAELISEYRKNKEKEFTTTTTKEYVEKVWTAYSKLGGNGVGESMYREIMGLPTSDE